MSDWHGHRDDDEEAPPTLGVREPRKPSPPSLSGTAKAEPETEAERTAEVACEGARVEVACKMQNTGRVKRVTIHVPDPDLHTTRLRGVGYRVHWKDGTIGTKRRTYREARDDARRQT